MSLNNRIYVGSNAIIGNDVSMNNRLLVLNDVSLNGRLYVEENIGLGIHNPSCSLDIEKPDALRIPVGSEAEKSNFTNNLEFGISKVYPNPFNPTVNFDVQLLKTEKINIYVYDLIGNKIATLHSGVLQSGSHSFNWDATDFSTGLYIIQCKSQNIVSNQKVLLMK